jgi:hypothetical protein
VTCPIAKKPVAQSIHRQHFLGYILFLVLGCLNQRARRFKMGALGVELAEEEVGEPNSQAATTAGYQKASDSMELIIGLLGKDHALSVILRQLRSE